MKKWLLGSMAGLMLAAGAYAQDAAAPSAAEGEEYIGVVKKVDRSNNKITVELPLDPDANITRDGAKVSLSAIRPGDDVRASFEPSSEGVTRLDVESKEMMEKKMKMEK